MLLCSPCLPPHFAIEIKLCPSIRISVCYSVSALIFSVGVWSFSLMSIIYCPFLPKTPMFVGFSPPFWYFIRSPHPHHASSLCLPPVSVPKGAIALGHFGDKTFACHLIPSGHHTAGSKKFQPLVSNNTLIFSNVGASFWRVPFPFLALRFYRCCYQHRHHTNLTGVLLLLL